MQTFLQDKFAALLLKQLDSLQCPNDDDQIAALEIMCNAWDGNDENSFHAAWEQLKFGCRLGIREDLPGQAADSNFEQPHARAKNVIEKLKIRVTPSDQSREAKTNG